MEERPRLNASQQSLIYVVLALGLIGILDAGFLVYKHYTGGALPCTIFEGCDVVTTSRYSAILGVPISVPGLLYYVYIFGMALAVLDKKNLNFLKYLFYPSAVGLLFSVYLVAIQVFVLHSICMYCMISAVNSVLIFSIVAYLYFKFRPKKNI